MLPFATELTLHTVEETTEDNSLNLEMTGIQYTFLPLKHPAAAAQLVTCSCLREKHVKFEEMNNQDRRTGFPKQILKSSENQLHPIH
jgi:hypothetical protein